MKLGSVPYLNAKPLCEGLEVEYDVPSALAAKLRDGTYDAALVPIAECLLNPEYILVDNVGLGCTGSVYSVILAHEVPLQEIQTIALDPASVTSNLLFKILAKELVSSRARYVKPEDKSNAQVLIGDAAIRFRHNLPQIPVLDLGEAWNKLTSLPFVFAVWAMRPEAATPELAQLLREAKNRGLAKRREIALNDFEYRYLTEHIHYDLAALEKNGILHFARSLLSSGFIPQLPEFTWI
jgi:chorismate dehydratase